MEFVFDSYMENVAGKLKEIGHNPADKSKNRFHRVSGIVNMEGLLQAGSYMTGRQLLIEDNLAGGLGDRGSEHILESPYFSFFVVEKAAAQDLASRNKVIEDCYATMKKIMARMRYDQRRDRNGLLFLNYNSIRYESIGPVGDNYHGVWCSFTITNPAVLNINRDDWTDGVSFDSMI